MPRSLAAAVLVLTTLQLACAPTAPTARLGGVTTDEAARPLFGVEVEVRLAWRRLATNQFWRQAPIPTEPLARARSDGDGRFAIEVEPGPEYEVTCRLTGYRTARAEVRADRPFGIRLVQGNDDVPAPPPSLAGGVAGTIRDATTGEPVAGAAIRLPWEHAPLAQSDARGRYAVAWSEKAAQDLKLVVAPGYRIATLAKEAFARPAPAAADVALEPGSVVSGRVVDAKGRGLAGLRIVTDTDLRVRPDHTYSGIAWSLATDAEGRFRVGELVPGNRFWLRALLADGTPIELGEGRAGEAPLDLGTIPAGPTTAVSGVVTGKDGVRVEDGRVHALRLLDHAPAQWLVAHDTPSWPIDGSGRYRIPRLPPGRHELCFSVEGAEHEVRVVEAKPGGGSLSLDVEIGKGRCFRGRVVDGDGQPIDGALLRAFAWSEHELLPLVPPGKPDHVGRFLAGNVRVLTKPDGTFLLERIRSHLPIRLTVQKAGYQTATLRVEVGAEPPAEIRLEKG